MLWTNKIISSTYTTPQQQCTQYSHRISSHYLALDTVRDGCHCHIGDMSHHAIGVNAIT